MTNHPSDTPDTCCPTCGGDGEMSEERVAQALKDAESLAALRRIVRRALACGQLEKLEDARPYLGEVQAAPPTAAPQYPSYCKITGHVFPCGCASCDVLKTTVDRYGCPHGRLKHECAECLVFVDTLERVLAPLRQAPPAG